MSETSNIEEGRASTRGRSNPDEQILGRSIGRSSVRNPERLDDPGPISRGISTTFSDQQTRYPANATEDDPPMAVTSLSAAAHSDSATRALKSHLNHSTVSRTDDTSSHPGEEELKPEDLEKIKAKTMYRMVDELEDGRGSTKLLFLTNLQAEQIASSPTCLDRMMDALELPDPKLVINLLISPGFRPWTEIRKVFYRQMGKGTPESPHWYNPGAFFGVVQGQPPFLNPKDEHEEEACIDHFMKDVLLPLASRTHAIILCAGTRGDCILSDALTRVFAIQRSRWGSKPPFSIVHVTPQLKDLYANPDKDASWISIKDSSNTWRNREGKLFDAFHGSKNQKGLIYGGIAEDPKTGKSMPPFGAKEKNSQRKTDLHKAESIMCCIVVDAIDRGKFTKEMQLKGKDPPAPKLDLAPFNRLINELVRHLSETRPSVSIKTGFTSKDKIDGLMINPSGLGVAIAHMQNGTPTIFLDTRRREPLPRLAPALIAHRLRERVRDLIAHRLRERVRDSNLVDDVQRQDRLKASYTAHSSLPVIRKTAQERSPMPSTPVRLQTGDESVAVRSLKRRNTKPFSASIGEEFMGAGGVRSDSALEKMASEALRMSSPGYHDALLRLKECETEQKERMEARDHCQDKYDEATTCLNAAEDALHVAKEAARVASVAAKKGAAALPADGDVAPEALAKDPEVVRKQKEADEADAAFEQARTRKNEAQALCDSSERLVAAHDAYLDSIERAQLAWTKLVELEEAVVLTEEEFAGHSRAGAHSSASADEWGILADDKLSTDARNERYNTRLRSFMVDAHQAQRASLIEFAKLELVIWFEKLLVSEPRLAESFDCMCIAYLRDAMHSSVDITTGEVLNHGSGYAQGRVVYAEGQDRVTLAEAIEQAGSESILDASGKQLDAMGSSKRLLHATPEQAEEAATWLADRIFFYSYHILDELSQRKNGDYQEAYGERMQAAAILNGVCLTSPHFHALNLQPEHNHLVRQVVMQLVRLDRLPKETSLEGLLLLRDAWREYDVAMHLADSYKVAAKLLFCFQLLVAWLIVLSSTLFITREATGGCDAANENDGQVWSFAVGGARQLAEASGVETLLADGWRAVQGWGVDVTTASLATLLSEGSFALAVVSSVLISLEGVYNAKKRWRQLRGGALSLESLVWCYRTRVGPFQLDTRNPDSDTPERNLCQALVAWRRELVASGDLSLSAFGKAYPPNVYKHHQGPAPSTDDETNVTRSTEQLVTAANRTRRFRYMRTSFGSSGVSRSETWRYWLCCLFCRRPPAKPQVLAGGDNFHSPVKPELYIQQRIRVAISFYQRRIPVYARARNIIKTIMIITAVCSTVFARYELMPVVSVITAFGAAITSWGEFGDAESKVGRYTRACFTLTNLLSWWNSLSEVERASTSNIAQLIVSTERTIAEESLAWMAAAQSKSEDVEQQARERREQQETRKGDFGANDGTVGTSTTRRRAESSAAGGASIMSML